jgi:uncharacterized repeat protein (TIGR03803 family)
MRKRPFSTTTTLIAFVVLASSSLVFGAAKESVLTNFPQTQDGVAPAAGVIFDSAGNLYGTTAQGGSDTTGAAFQLVPNGDGTWTENVLHSFLHTNNDGWQPEASLVMDAKGNLYGTTVYGGANCEDQGGCGTVFELSPGSGGSWTYSIIYNFCDRTRCEDGNFPYGALILDGSGNLYGTTYGGGTRAVGTVFELSPSGGKWTETVLHSFTGTTADGSRPQSTLIFDKSGNLYATTRLGGTKNLGTVFELTPAGKGKWKETVLHDFVGGADDGANPDDGVVLDAAGDLYGTTINGGCSDYGCGTVYELVMHSDGQRSRKILLNLCTAVGCPGGNNPRGGLIMDSKNNLYGTTTAGGANLYGTAFKLSSNGKGIWKETVLHSFPSSETDGYTPESSLIFDKDGNLYGTTGSCRDGNGTVFKISF